MSGRGSGPGGDETRRGAPRPGPAASRPSASSPGIGSTPRPRATPDPDPDDPVDEPTHDPWADRRNRRGPGTVDVGREDPRVVVPRLDRSGWTVTMARPGRAIRALASVLVLLRGPIAMHVVHPSPGPVARDHWLMLTLGGAFLSAGIVSALDR